MNYHANTVPGQAVLVDTVYIDPILKVAEKERTSRIAISITGTVLQH